MSISIYANGSRQNFDCGYAGFFRLRSKIANIFDPVFGAHYATLPGLCTSPEGIEIFNKTTDIILAAPRLEKLGGAFS